MSEAVVASGSRRELRIEGITSEGAGVGRLDEGLAVFVHRTAPGDRVSVEITEIHKRWARANLLDLVEPGPDRRDPLCPHYRWCGGCTLEHLTYPAQLEWKSRFLVDALARIGGIQVGLESEAVPSPKETRYRNRVTMTLLRVSGGAVRAGFHRLERPGMIIDIDGRCLLPEKPVAVAWDDLRRSWGPGARHLPGGPRLSLTLRRVGEVDILLFVEGGSGSGDPERLLSEVPSLKAIWHQSEGSQKPPVLLAGQRPMTESWHGEEVEVGPSAFLQVNREAAHRLHAYVLGKARAQPAAKIVDAYCGYGFLGRRLAKDGTAEVVGIEMNPEAARFSARHPVSGFRMLEGRVEEVLPTLLPADLVIVNPPRTGVRASVVDSLLETPPSGIVYVSCDPATLARDVSRLTDVYRVAGLKVFDLFPQTAHTETVLTLVRS